jgi:hypothetical protein
MFQIGGGSSERLHSNKRGIEKEDMFIGRCLAKVGYYCL